MKAPVFVAISAIALAAIAIAVGCQTYDFEPVQPLAIAQTTATYATIGKSFKPNMALLVDKSGSMALPIDGNNTACDVGLGFPSPCGQTGKPFCPAACPTRWTDLKAAMGSFLTSSGSLARLGAALFPPGGCNAASTMTVPVSTSNDVPSEMQATANQILSSINSTNPGGGTPTAPSIAFMASNQALYDPDRSNFILLLTDGLPNCNSTFEPPYPDAACHCTEANPASCQNSPRQLCLDQTNTVAAITSALNDHGIRTIVVGFGGDTAAGDGPMVLQAMAAAGGFPRECTSGTDAECGTGRCDTASKKCVPGFYQASNAADLSKVLENIAKKISQTPCDYQLDVSPSDPAFISVLVNGQAITRGPDTWQFLGPGGDAGTHGEVQLIGALCQQAKGATEENPVSVEIRLLRTF